MREKKQGVEGGDPKITHNPNPKANSEGEGAPNRKAKVKNNLLWDCPRYCFHYPHCTTNKEETWGQGQEVGTFFYRTHHLETNSTDEVTVVPRCLDSVLTFKGQIRKKKTF